ncbi:Ubiquinone biosynthesis accessory factor UbiT [Gammaproteobacteria bacterium]
MANPTTTPKFPTLLATPLGWIPISVHSTAIAFALNHVFSSQIRSGELDFLADRTLAIQAPDACLTFRISLSNGQLVASEKIPNLVIGGSVYDLLLLGTGREDPDTLFFQRRLTLDGDTELGLYVKNFLNSQDLSSLLPAPAQGLLPHLAPMYARLFG